MEVEITARKIELQTIFAEWLTQEINEYRLSEFIYKFKKEYNISEEECKLLECYPVKELKFCL